MLRTAFTCGSVSEPYFASLPGDVDAPPLHEVAGEADPGGLAVE
jgi:hypothetical protein